jgi:hypothetical protein
MHEVLVELDLRLLPDGNYASVRDAQACRWDFEMNRSLVLNAMEPVESLERTTPVWYNAIDDDDFL